MRICAGLLPEIIISHSLGPRSPPLLAPVTQRTPLPTLTPVICGPTAGGKSDLAVDLALTLRDKHHIPAEIVTADAFQIYTGLDIGTAKPTIPDRRGIPHHLIDIVPPPPLPTPNSPLPPAFTLDDWLARANATIANLRSRHILPIVVGGTHLYIKALLEGIFEGPEPDPELRAALSAMDPAARRAELERVDPLAAQRIHPNDIRRTIRALEVFKLTGQPISAHQKQWDRGGGSGQSAVASGKGIEGQEAESSPLHTAHSPLPFLLITLDWPSESLNLRINARVRQMMEQGLLEEVRSLILSNGFTSQSAEALGYKQLIPIVRAALVANTWPPPAAALSEAVEKIKIETRRFGKNQRTWLRRLSTTPGSLHLPGPDLMVSPSAPTSRADRIQQTLNALNLPT